MTSGATVELELAASTTIGSLKARLSDSFAERPPPNEQRLIYCGKICNDDSSLREVLRSLESPQTFHLVLCPTNKPRRPSTIPAPPAPAAAEEASHALPAEVLEAAGAAYEHHLSFAAIYAEAVREGRWSQSTAGVFDEAVANAGIPMSPPQRFATLLETPPVVRDTLPARLARLARSNPALQLIDFRLALKLAAAVALLGYDGNRSRLACLACLASAVFLAQTGLATLALRHFALDLNRVPNHDWRRLATNALISAASGRIPVRQARSRFNPFTEVAIAAATFGLSLAPAWRPNAAIDHPHQD